MTELGPAARSLIAAVGHADDPSDGDQERVRRALALSLGAGAIATTTVGSAAVAGSAAAGGTLAAKATPIAQLLLWFGLGAAGGVAVSVTAAASWPSAPISEVAPPAVTAPSAPGPAPRQATHSSRVPASPRVESSGPVWLHPARNPTREPAARAERATDDATASGPSRVATAAFPDSASGFSEEVRLLQLAQQARAAGRCDQSLRLLDEYARRFPRGALGSESLTARALCLCELGRGVEARAQRDRLGELHPGSPHLERLLRSCAGESRK
jgi:hypothetical protein